MIGKAKKERGGMGVRVLNRKSWGGGGGIPCQQLFSFQKDAEDPAPPSSKGTFLFLVLNMLQTEHVNTPGEHIQML